jgi:phosphonatase-like hydrolase
MKIELVVFDMAGTTVRDNDAVNECLRQALAANQISVTRDEVNEVMGMPKPLAIKLLMEKKLPPGIATVAAANAIHEAFLARMLHYYHTDPAVQEVEGATHVFQQLRRAGLRVALDTGFSRPIVNAILTRLHWANGGLLNATVASDEVVRGRPYPDLVFQAMKLTGITDVKRVAKVGDTPSDLNEGQSAGCGLVVGVTNGSHTREQLAPHPHTHLIDRLTDLPDLVLAATN